MAVHFLLAELWRDDPPARLDLDIYFRRPIFWDERFTVSVAREDGAWRALALVRDGKVLTEARINERVSLATGGKP
jgi:hypothetical protein